jgi:hypothetical protein
VTEGWRAFANKDINDEIVRQADVSEISARSLWNQDDIFEARGILLSQ